MCFSKCLRVYCAECGESAGVRQIFFLLAPFVVDVAARGGVRGGG